MANIDIEHILEIANTIRESTIVNKEEYFKNRYQIFQKKFPQLYKKICNDDKFDMGNLKFMLDMIQGIQSQKQDTYNAEVQVGQMLFDKYVKNNVKQQSNNNDINIEKNQQ